MIKQCSLGFTEASLVYVRTQLLQSCPTLCDPRTIACQAPLFMDSSGKNTGLGCHTLLQGIFLTQESNTNLLLLLHWQAGSLPLGLLGKPRSFSKIFFPLKSLKGLFKSLPKFYAIVLHLFYLKLWNFDVIWWCFCPVTKSCLTFATLQTVAH